MKDKTNKYNKTNIEKYIKFVYVVFLTKTWLSHL